MTDENSKTRIALSRGNVYAFLTEAFLRLPDEDFLNRITGVPTQIFLNQLKKLNHEYIKDGINKIQSFLAEADRADRTALLEALAVDRTRLIRSAGKRNLKAPYEGLYKKQEDAHEVILEVTKFYKRIGTVPVSYAKDSLDFFCTEMDFMRQLCLMEADKKNNAEEIRSMEKEFLERHLASWIGDYCKAAAEYAGTDFYKGLLLLLNGFIALEKSYEN